LLLTNDGELTQLLTHPSHGVVKTYLAEVEGEPTPGTLRALREGVELDDGLTAPAKVTLVQQQTGSAAVEIGIHEGRNRQVRRMFEAVGHPVRRLVRVRIGPLADRSLAPGEWRALTSAEVRGLYAAAQDAGVTATPEPLPDAVPEPVADARKDPGGDGGPG
jgi:23S rRNA pseudouridine2605 synthase